MQRSLISERLHIDPQARDLCVGKELLFDLQGHSGQWSPLGHKRIKSTFWLPCASVIVVVVLSWQHKISVPKHPRGIGVRFPAKDQVLAQ